MIWWLVDRSTLFYLLLGMIGCALAVCWWQTRRGTYAVAAIVVAAAALLLYLLTLFVITDRQRLPMIIEEMSQGVLDGNPDAVVKHLAQDLKIGNRNRADFIRDAEKTIRQRGISELHLWDFDIEELARAERKAQLVFRVRAQSRWGDFVATCRTWFVLEGNDWKLRDLEVIPGINSKGQPVTIPLP